jgi:hypothetical protein
MINLQLISTGGDMHTGGLSNKPTRIKINYKNKKSVDTFLKYQNEFHLCSYDKSFPNKTTKKIYKKYLKSFRKLKDLNIFDTKWHFRTSWKYREI